MDKEEIEVQLALSKLNGKLELEKEFERLSPNIRSGMLRLIGTLVLMLSVVWLFPEIIEQPVSYVLLFLILGTSAEIYHESRRINKRMDTLYKLLKNDA